MANSKKIRVEFQDPFAKGKRLGPTKPAGRIDPSNGEQGALRTRLMDPPSDPFIGRPLPPPGASRSQESLGGEPVKKGIMKYPSGTDLAQLGAALVDSIPNIDKYLNPMSVPEETGPLPPNDAEYVRLVRPARHKTVRYEYPFTIQRFFDAARELYPIAKKGELVLQIHFEANKSKRDFREVELQEQNLKDKKMLDWWNNDIARTFQQNEFIRVIRVHDQITVRDGRNISQGSETWDPMREGVAVREVRRELEQIAQRLLGHGIEAPGEAGGLVNIQVDRFKGEWIRWHTSMSDQDFLHRVIWWIDDPMINIYPGDWERSANFEDSEAARLKLAASKANGELTGQAKRNGEKKGTTQGGHLPKGGDQPTGKHRTQGGHSALENDGSGVSYISCFILGGCDEDLTNADGHLNENLVAEHANRHHAEIINRRKCIIYGCHTPQDVLNENEQRQHLEMHARANANRCTARGCNCRMSLLAESEQEEHIEMHREARKNQALLSGGPPPGGPPPEGPPPKGGAASIGGAPPKRGAPPKEGPRPGEVPRRKAPGEEAPEPPTNPQSSAKKLDYCSVCKKQVARLGAARKAKHLADCNGSILALTKDEAAQQDPKKSPKTAAGAKRPSDEPLAPSGKAKKTKVTVKKEKNEDGEDEVQVVGERELEQEGRPRRSRRQVKKTVKVKQQVDDDDDEEDDDDEDYAKYDIQRPPRPKRRPRKPRAE